MGHLTVLNGPDTGTRISLDRVTCIGRGLDMDYRLEDLTVSKRHARVLRNERGEYIIEDLASSNGTFLNGTQVMTRQLEDGDEIRIGETIFRFVSDKGEAGTVHPPDRTVINIGREEKTGSSVISSVDVSHETAERPILQETTVEALSNANYRLSTLLEISQYVGRVLEEEQLLNTILEKLFEVFPESNRGFIILRDPDTGDLVPRASKFRGAGASEEERLQISETILEFVVEQKQAVLSTEAPSDERFATSQSILDFQMRSVMCAPLMYEEDVLGFIWMDTQRIASNYDEGGLTLLASIANQAALYIANARLHGQLLHRERLEQDLRNARRIQNSFLPKEPPQVEGYEFVDWYDTALEVGGDFYDIVELPSGKVLVVVGDVSGKGITAALMMAKMTSNVRFFASAQPEPAVLLDRLNETALASATDMFVTMLIMFLDPADNSVAMSNAGHCYPMVRRADGSVERVEGAHGFPVGINEDAEFPETAFSVGPGETVCVFTDGIIEAMDEQGKLFGYRKLARSMEQAGDSAVDVVKSIQKAVREHAGSAAQSDDLTLVCMSRLGGSAEA